MDVRSCAARLAISPPVTGGGSLLLSATSPVMGISSRADRVYQRNHNPPLIFIFFILFKSPYLLLGGLRLLVWRVLLGSSVV